MSITRDKEIHTFKTTFININFFDKNILRYSRSNKVPGTSQDVHFGHRPTPFTASCLHWKGLASTSNPRSEPVHPSICIKYAIKNYCRDLFNFFLSSKICFSFSVCNHTHKYTIKEAIMVTST